MKRLATVIAAVLLFGGCAQQPPSPTAKPACPPCPTCPAAETPPPSAPPIQTATWNDLPGWNDDDPSPAFTAFRASCDALAKKELWQSVCAEATDSPPSGADGIRTWFETRFRPWALVNPDGSRSGLVTGYYEPVIHGSRNRKAPYLYPLFGPPDDLIDVELSDLYPELKHMRLRGRLEGRRLVPYYSRAEWSTEEAQRAGKALLWIDDALDLFFMQIQGSGQVALDDGSRIRVNYADQNGHPYRSIGRWLIDQGQITLAQASMQGIKAWAAAHPQRLQELLDANPSVVFFRELPAEGSGPPGALGVPLTPERSVAVDPRHIPLGAPVYIATTYPNSDRPLDRLMLAQDTGGAIRGVVRADFYWGSGDQAGREAGRMRQQGQLWLIMPNNYSPE